MSDAASGGTMLTKFESKSNRVKGVACTRAAGAT